MAAELIGRERAVVLPVRVDPAGVTGPTKREAAGPDWRRSSRGRHVPSRVELTAMQRVAEAGVLLPRFGAVTGWAGLAWERAWWFAGILPDGETPAPVPIALPFRTIRTQPGLHVCNERWSPDDVVVVDGLRITRSARSVVYEMRYAPSPWQAASRLDMAAYHDLVSIAEASVWIDSHPSYTGIEQARQGRHLADENAWSPREHVPRLVWQDAGYPRPLANRPLFDPSGSHLGTPDLVDPRTGVLVEYDGPLHLAAERRTSDLRREHVFREHGLEPVTMVRGDLPDTGPFLARLRAAYLRAERRPAAERRWTLELPPWWVPTFTVEQRRALSDAEKAIWLRHRKPDLLPLAG